MKRSVVYRRKQSEAFLALGRIRRRIEARSEALLGEQELADITPAQANALMVLFQAREPIHARRVADEMGVSEATVSRFVRALEATGWVRRERDPNDSRVRTLVPTERAYEALPRFIAVFNQVLDDAFEGFSVAEMKVMADFVGRVHANLDRAR